MKLVMGGINGTYMRDLIERASRLIDGKRETEAVWAAVAYASDAGLLFDWCWNNKVPLRFWGKLDETVPVTIGILDLFLKRGSPNFVCKLVQHHHAKVIWWRGFGVYLGSANLTSSAWYKNVEAGVFFLEEEIDDDLAHELAALFLKLESEASPLTQELRDLMATRARQISQVSKALDPSWFWGHPSLRRWPGLVQTTKKSARERRDCQEFCA